jgi:hypothetical protein
MTARAVVRLSQRGESTMFFWAARVWMIAVLQVLLPRFSQSVILIAFLIFKCIFTSILNQSVHSSTEWYNNLDFVLRFNITSIP